MTMNIEEILFVIAFLSNTAVFDRHMENKGKGTSDLPYLQVT